MKVLSDLEQAVLDKLLVGDSDVLATLREQINGAKLARREYTGAGFYCDIEVDSRAPTVRGNLELGDVSAVIPSLKHGAGFLLFVRDGRVTMLEGFTYDEPWPDSVRGFSLSYIDPSRKEVLARLA
jgi:hypothetical protein